MKKMILHPLGWLSIVAVIAWAMYSGKVLAEPMIAAEEGHIRIVVYTEPCQLKAVKNLSNRATWTENGKVIEGCAGPSADLQIVMFYFADMTIVAVPFQFFQKVSGA